MDLTCLTNYAPIPEVPKLANDSNIFVPQKYDPGSGGLAQIISASLARSTFSTNDVRFLIDTLLNDGTSKFSSLSDVVDIKPIPSIIIYGSIALAFVLVFSLVFCIASCRCCSRKYQVGISPIFLHRLSYAFFAETTTTKIMYNSNLCVSIVYFLPTWYW